MHILIWIFLPFSLAQDVYDYIVVGCGSTGSVIASRLSEDTNQRVLLLEAGIEPSKLSYIPLLPFIQLGKLINRPTWSYKIYPQKHSFFGFKHRAPPWISGRVLGGTSTLNANLYVRGRPQDFDTWAKQGAIGWNWENVLKYYIRSENNTDHYLLNNGFHGIGGPMTVSHSPYHSPLLKYFLTAIKEMGLTIADYNADHQNSFYITQGTIKNGRKRSSFSAFIQPYLQRKNLKLITSAVVTKILIDHSKRARGVTYEYFNVSKIVYAKKEVIVSAGAINSAKLLMLSGIGPGWHLQELGIPVISDLPVGENFHDHIGMPIIFSIEKPYSFPSIKPSHFLQYKYFGKGPLTSLAGVEVLGFVKSTLEKENRPDILFILTGIPFVLGPNLRKDVHSKGFGGHKVKYGICGAANIRPKSRGFVRLKSSDPFDQPIINPNYFSNVRDLQVIIEGIRFCQAFGKTHAMKEIGTEELDFVFLSCKRYPRDSDDYLACLSRIFSAPLYHGAGTCRMGHPSDPRTVVDANLRVKGIRNLRIADCSVMPFQVSGLPHATAVMIGEKAADLIRFDYSDYSSAYFDQDFQLLNYQFNKI